MVKLKSENAEPRESLIDIEQLEAEAEDEEYSPISYEITSYPADFTLKGLNDKWRDGELEIPPFQRKFVWTQADASKLIESFILGIPVPPIFLYVRKSDSHMLVIDGQQRLKSIMYYFEGFFGEETRGKRPVFRLTGINKKSPYYGKTFEDLSEVDDAAYKKLKDSVLRSFIVKQLDPNDDTSIYHIFERLNTGGARLRGQEVRNCIYHGPFNNLLHRLNRLPKWRAILGKKNDDKRQKDIELILRFFALLRNSAKYEKPMKEFLNKFMSRHRGDSKEKLAEMEERFTGTIEAIHSNLGERPFHLRAGLNVAAFDSVAVAFAKNLDAIPKDISRRYLQLQKNDGFDHAITASTTDKEAVASRLRLASEVLFGHQKK